MSIEKAIADLTAALIANTEAVQALTKAQGGKAPAGKAVDKDDAKPAATGKGGKTTPKDDADEITKEVMQAALNKVKEDLSTDDAKDIIKEVVGKQIKMADIPEKHYAAIVKACKAKLEGGDDSSSSNDDDGL